MARAVSYFQRPGRIQIRKEAAYDSHLLRRPSRQRKTLFHEPTVHRRCPLMLDSVYSTQDTRKRTQALKRANDLHDSGISLDVLPVVGVVVDKDGDEVEAFEMNK